MYWEFVRCSCNSKFPCGWIDSFVSAISALSNENGAFDAKSQKRGTLDQNYSFWSLSCLRKFSRCAPKKLCNFNISFFCDVEILFALYFPRLSQEFVVTKLTICSWSRIKGCWMNLMTVFCRVEDDWIK